MAAMNKALQIHLLGAELEARGVSPDTVDLGAEIDATLTYPENLNGILARFNISEPEEKGKLEDVEAVEAGACSHALGECLEGKKYGACKHALGCAPQDAEAIYATLKEIGQGYGGLKKAWTGYTIARRDIRRYAWVISKLALDLKMEPPVFQPLILTTGAPGGGASITHIGMFPVSPGMIPEEQLRAELEEMEKAEKGMAEIEIDKAKEKGRRDVLTMTLDVIKDMEREYGTATKNQILNGGRESASTRDNPIPGMVDRGYTVRETEKAIEKLKLDGHIFEPKYDIYKST